MIRANTDLELDCRNVRKYHRVLRELMSQEEVQKKSACICERLVQTDWYQDVEWIYGYYPLGNEVDCLHFLEKAIEDGKRVALPRMANVGCLMDFYELTSLKQVAEGSFHVMEPTAECPLVKEHRAVVLVPGVVFDRQGNRYGYGKGYYDRYFARFPQLYKAALAYEHQLEDELVVSAWDVRMDVVCTEQQSCVIEARPQVAAVE